MTARAMGGVFFVVLALPPTLALAEGPERHAIVIGINDYADPAIPDLRFAESDAKAIYQTLVDPAIGRFKQDQVTLLLGKDATPSAIKAALYKLRGVGKGDLVVIFYSGHGAKEGDEAFWVTQGAERKALPATALSNSDIRKFLPQIPSERLVILLDCCYAASTIKKSLDDPASLFGAFAGKGRVTIAGAAENQEALEYEDKKAGVFTYFLNTGLRGKADGNTDGVVTFEELWTYLGDNVRRASVKQGGLHEPKIITEAGLTPQFLLTYNPAVRAENEQGVAALRKLFDERKITGAQYDEGFKALSEPAIDAESVARREVFADLVAGRLAPKYLKDVLDRRLKEARAEVPQPAGPTGKPTLAVVPFDTLGEIKAKDAGRILAEHLLPHFAGNYTLIDQTQLKHFVDQDDLTLAGLAELAKQPRTKALSKAVKLRAVRYLIVGTVSGLPDGSLSVTARMSDWQTGRIEGSRIGQIAASGWPDLLARMGHLAGKLGGSPGHVEVARTKPVVPPKPAAPPKDLTLDLGKGVTMDLVLIPAGEFMMGSKLSPSEVAAKFGGKEEYFKDEHPRHLVRIEKPFYMGKHEVTKAQFGAFVDASGHKTDAEKEGYAYVWTGEKWDKKQGVSWRDVGFEQTSTHPVVNVSWCDADAFCRWLARKSGRPVRLPTEAEWEYACRGGTDSVFQWGNDPDDGRGWCNAADQTAKQKFSGMRIFSWSDGHVFTAPVGSFKPNAFGVHDLIGNVWEWCGDWYDRYPSNTESSDSNSTKYRVVRGGSWLYDPWHCRSADRGWYTSVFRVNNFCKDVGFRVVSSAGLD